MKSRRARLFSVDMMRWIEIQFIFFCDYLGSQFEFFNIIKADVFENCSVERDFQRKLKEVRIIDIKLVKLIQLVREYFKWMLLLIITNDVINITIDVKLNLLVILRKNQFNYFSDLLDLWRFLFWKQSEFHS